MNDDLMTPRFFGIGVLFGKMAAFIEIPPAREKLLKPTPTVRHLSMS